jgi:hypothetical protein
MVAISENNRKRHPTKAKEYRSQIELQHPGHLKRLRRQWHEDHLEYSRTESLLRRERELISHPWRPLLRTAKARAKRKGIAFDLTDRWAAARWTGYCEVTGIPMSLAVRMRGGSFSPSIDKIDPKMGYTQKNCRFILYAVNVFKHEGDDDTMFMIAEAIINARTSLSFA